MIVLKIQQQQHPREKKKRKTQKKNYSEPLTKASGNKQFCS
jgi:hypothetical protein